MAFYDEKKQVGTVLLRFWCNTKSNIELQDTYTVALY